MKKLFFNMLVMFVFTGVLCVQAESNMPPKDEQVTASNVTSNEKESPNLEIQKQTLRNAEKIISGLSLIGVFIVYDGAYRSESNSCFSKSTVKYFLLSFIPHIYVNYKLFREHSDYRSVIKITPSLLGCSGVVFGEDFLYDSASLLFGGKLAFDSVVTTYDLYKKDK